MENKNGQGIFLGVIGVATLVVAIIGATFAFFSASASSGQGDISGQTLDIAGEALSMTATRHTFSNTTAPSLNLVPASMDGTTAAGVDAALTAKCEDDGYTGCHVYELVATNGTTQASASITLVLTLTGVQHQADWKYVVYTGAAEDADAITTNGSFAASGDTTVNILSNANLANGTHTYYLMIYLGNQNYSQNQNATANLNATGSYTGVVTFSAGGGEVSATFTA